MKPEDVKSNLLKTVTDFSVTSHHNIAMINMLLFLPAPHYSKTLYQAHLDSSQ